MATAGRGVWWQLACVDARLLLRDRRVGLAALGIVLVPAVYALIYLTSVWNPAARTGALPVLVVNADRGADFQGHPVRLGDELVRRMRERPTFGYELTADEDEARHAVASGRAQFAVLIASDFSQRALPGTEAGAARIVIYTSEGNDYSGAGFAKRFAPELARQVNEALNRERWTLVLQKAAGAQVSLDELHIGVARLLNGARDQSQGTLQPRQGTAELQRAMGQAQEGAGALRQGSAQAAAGGNRLADGVRRLGSGLRGAVARLPAEAELQGLLAASEAMAQGQLQLGQGLLQLHDGALQLEDGAGRFKAEGERLLLVGDRVAAGAGQLQDGLGRLAGGLGEAREAQARLADGQGRLHAGTRALVDGLLPLAGGLRQTTQGLPADDELQRLSQGLAQLEGGAAALGGGLQGASGGTQKLAAGLQRLEGGAQALSTGLQALAGALPAASPLATGTTGGNAGGMAGPVQPVVEVVAPVPANGAGFAPNFIAVALWVGATLCTFLWPLRRLPELPVAVKEHALSTVLGKLALPALLAGLQALAVLVMLKTLLPAPMPGGWRLLATLLVAAFTFLAVLLALVRLLGETGKAVALLLLVTQISAAGGTLPVALTTDFHRAIHPFLPFTWVIRALRAAMFGAYEGAWAPAIGALAAGGVVALAAAVWLGRWKRVPLADYRPALDMD